MLGGPNTYTRTLEKCFMPGLEKQQNALRNFWNLLRFLWNGNKNYDWVFAFVVLKFIVEEKENKELLELSISLRPLRWPVFSSKLIEKIIKILIIFSAKANSSDIFRNVKSNFYEQSSQFHWLSFWHTLWTLPHFGNYFMMNQNFNNCAKI